MHNKPTVIVGLIVIVFGLIGGLGILGTKREPVDIAPTSLGRDEAAVTVIAVTVVSANARVPSRGWNPGDKVTIRGSGFTHHDNAIYSTDGESEAFIARADSVDGKEIVFVLPEGFRAPFGTGLRVKNLNGVGSNIPPGERRNY